MREKELFIENKILYIENKNSKNKIKLIIQHINIINKYNIIK